MPHKDSASAQPALRAAVVFNPTKVDVEAMRAAAAKEPSTRGWAETLWFGTTAEDPGQGQTREALEAGASLIIVAGGDGTVRAAAEALDGSGAALAIVPSGRGNLLARNLKLTLDDLPHSIHTAFGGTDLAIDLARIEIRRPDESVTKHAFVVMAGL